MSLMRASDSVFRFAALRPARGRCEAVRNSAACGEHIVTGDDFVLGDDDGVVFVPLVRAAEVADLAASIRDTERSQAVHMQLGTSFRSQSRFDDYIAARQSGRDLTFRQHLRAIGGAIEV